MATESLPSLSTKLFAHIGATATLKPAAIKKLKALIRLPRLR